MRTVASSVLALGALALVGTAEVGAQPAPSPAVTPLAPTVTTPAPAPPPYSLPWQLRPAMPVSVVRSDTVIALQNNDAVTVASMLLASYKVLPWLAPFVRLGIVGNSPHMTPSGTSFVNPALGATAAVPLPHGLRLGLFLGLTIPVGMGGGDTPDPGQAAASGAGIYARSALDNAMFAVDYFTVFPGVDFAWLYKGLTVQVEVTVLELIRVRGANRQTDETRTNFTAGLHVGYFVIPQLSIGAELRYQRWLTTPAAVTRDPTARDELTVAGGVRGHFKIAGRFWLRPGLAYVRGLDDPMAARGYNIVQVDVPFVF